MPREEKQIEKSKENKFTRDPSNEYWIQLKLLNRGVKNGNSDIEKNLKLSTAAKELEDILRTSDENATFEWISNLLEREVDSGREISTN